MSYVCWCKVKVFQNVDCGMSGLNTRQFHRPVSLWWGTVGSPPPRTDSGCFQVYTVKLGHDMNGKPRLLFGFVGSCGSVYVINRFGCLQLMDRTLPASLSPFSRQFTLSSSFPFLIIQTSHNMKGTLIISWQQRDTVLLWSPAYLVLSADRLLSPWARKSWKKVGVWLFN